MDTTYTNKKVYVKGSALDGLGVFAAKRIKKGGMVECSPILVLGPHMRVMEESSALWGSAGRDLNDFVYSHDNSSVVGLGYCSFYNNGGGKPNAEWVIDIVARTITVIALTSIPKDAEILIQYSDETAKGWIPTYLTWLDESQANAMSEQDFDTAKRYSEAIKILKGDDGDDEE